jgi:hypothetical protein
MPLLLVFAGGCLSGAVLIGFMREQPESARAPKPMKAWEGRAVTLAHASDSRDGDDGATSAMPAEPEVGTASPKSIEPSDGDAPEAGDSLAEVLARLEATYREGLTPSRVAPATPPSAPDHVAPALAAAPVSSAVAAAAPVAAATRPVELPAPTPKSVHVPVQPAPALENEAPRVVASRDEAPARNVHVGDVNNVNIGSVHLGDVVQVQQLALLQYMQLLALTPGAGIAAPRAGRVPPAHAPRRQLPRRPPPFSTSLTDPNNPWGFDFPPTVLAK